MIKCNQKDILSIVNNEYLVVSADKFEQIEYDNDDFVCIALSRTGNYFLCYLDEKLIAYKVI